MVVYDAGTDEVRSLSAATRTAETLDPGAFRPARPGYLENRRGAPAASTPGSVNDWEALWEEYGEPGWSRLLEPAIAQAEGGFVLDAENAGWIGSEFYTFRRTPGKYTATAGYLSRRVSASYRRTWGGPCA